MIDSVRYANRDITTVTNVYWTVRVKYTNRRFITLYDQRRIRRCVLAASRTNAENIILLIYNHSIVICKSDPEKLDLLIKGKGETLQ